MEVFLNNADSFYDITGILVGLICLLSINRWCKEFEFKTSLNILFIGFCLTELGRIFGLHDLWHENFHFGYHLSATLFLIIFTISFITEIKVLRGKGGLLSTKVIDIVPDMVWVKDKDFKFTYVNDSFAKELLKCTRKHAIGKTSLELSLEQKAMGFRHDFGELCLDSDTSIANTLESGRFLEIGKVHSRPLALQVVKAPLFDKEGAFAGIVGVGRDISYDVSDHAKLEALYKAKKFEAFEAFFEVHKYRYIHKPNDPTSTSFENCRLRREDFEDLQDVSRD